MKDKIISVIFTSILFIVPILGLCLEDRDISLFERRKLMNKETLRENIISNLDDYMTEQFPFRDMAISISSVYKRVFLNNFENNNVYLSGEYIIDKNYPLDSKSLNGYINKINYINEKYLKNSNVYQMIIPDKSYFLDDKKYLKIDYDYVTNELKKNIDTNYIDIYSIMKLEDYFKSDIHIKQDSYFKVIEQMDKYLNFGYKSVNYEKKVFNNFYGASSSKVHFTEPEELVYLVNEYTNEAIVNHLEYGKKDVYDESMLGGVDSYNIFLSGPSGVIEIEKDLEYGEKTENHGK